MCERQSCAEDFWRFSFSFALLFTVTFPHILGEEKKKKEKKEQLESQNIQISNERVRRFPVQFVHEHFWSCEFDCCWATDPTDVDHDIEGDIHWSDHSDNNSILHRIERNIQVNGNRSDGEAQNEREGNYRTWWLCHRHRWICSVLVRSHTMRVSATPERFRSNWKNITDSVGRRNFDEGWNSEDSENRNGASLDPVGENCQYGPVE